MVLFTAHCSPRRGGPSPCHLHSSRLTFSAEPAIGTDPLSPLRLRFAPDNGSVPKAPAWCPPGRQRRLPLQPRASADSPHSSHLTPHNPVPPAMGTDPSSSLRLRFAADNGSVPKAPVSGTPRHGDRPFVCPSASLRCGQWFSPQGFCFCGAKKSGRGCALIEDKKEDWKRLVMDS